MLNTQRHPVLQTIRANNQWLALYALQRERGQRLRYAWVVFRWIFFLTSPSGVSDGHSIPHWDGCRERGPLTFLVFSNWEEILVIIPRAEMKERRDRTWVTPWRSILNLFRDQLPWWWETTTTQRNQLMTRISPFLARLALKKKKSKTDYFPIRGNTVLGATRLHSSVWMLLLSE